MLRTQTSQTYWSQHRITSNWILFNKYLRGDTDNFKRIYNSYRTKAVLLFISTYKLTFSSNRVGAIIIYSAYKQEVVSEMKNILESMTDAFFSVDKSWNITYINEYGKTLLSQVLPSFNYNNSESPSLLETEFFPFLQQVMLEQETRQQEIFIPSIPTWSRLKPIQ